MGREGYEGCESADSTFGFDDFIFLSVSLLKLCTQPKRLKVYTLLNENYVEDSDAMYRFDYKKPFLIW